MWGSFLSYADILKWWGLGKRWICVSRFSDFHFSQFPKHWFSDSSREKLDHLWGTTCSVLLWCFRSLPQAVAQSHVWATKLIAEQSVFVSKKLMYWACSYESGLQSLFPAFITSVQCADQTKHTPCTRQCQHKKTKLVIGIIYQIYPLKQLNIDCMRGVWGGEVGDTSNVAIAQRKVQTKVTLIH